jgi:hypothetical protein
LAASSGRADFGPVESCEIALAVRTLIRDEVELRLGLAPVRINPPKETGSG